MLDEADLGEATDPSSSDDSAAPAVATRWRPSLQAHLMALVAVFVVVVAVAAVYQRSRTLSQVRDQAGDDVAFQAELAADSIGDALVVAMGTVGELAVNPALPDLLAAPEPSECSLAFNGASPFSGGHIDLVDREGTVRCSSRPLPGPGVYEDASWLDADGDVPTVVGPIDDPATDASTLVVAAPVDGLGVVAAFLELDDVPGELTRRLSGPLDVEFALVQGELSVGGRIGLDRDDMIVGDAVVPVIGWTVEAGADRSQVTADADALFRQLAIFLLAALLVLLVATQLIYRRAARPIEQLSSSVRKTMTGDASGVVPTTGPAEIVSLAEDFSALSRGMAAELARRERAEEEARASEHSYRTLFDVHPVPMWIYDLETLAFLEVNDAAVRNYGYSRDEFLGMTIRDIRPVEELPALMDSVTTSEPAQRSGPWRHVTKSGDLVEAEITSHVVIFAERQARFVMAEDVTQRERTQRLLQQAQRMESLGQLAGGIAHDFNNILAVILNYSEFAAETLADAAEDDHARWQPVLRDIEHVGDAGRRAATLTHQLLAFARGESAEVGVVDLNGVVAGLEQLLRRTLGERIELDVSLESDVAVVANEGQIEQVIVNLAVNARDAMPNGGRLSIQTSDIDVDEDHRDRPELMPGRYALLRVSDTGTGMSAAVRDRALEPFFTTKDRGSGTGLGLATVYGIVTRAGGTVRIYSEPGHGTSISVLLPATESAVLAVDRSVPERGSTGSETILVVEDDDELRALAERILSEANYRVLTAADGASALELAQHHRGDVHLVLTDVVMPGMLGTELAARLSETQPDLRVLLMSGYAPPVLAASGNLAVGVPLVDKPFSARPLREKVREVLDGPPPSQL